MNLSAKLSAPKSPRPLTWMARLRIFVRLRQDILLAIAALAIALGLRNILVSRMPLHMLIQIPLIMLAGVLLARGFHAWLASTAPPRLQNLLHRLGNSWNHYGIPGLLYATLATMYWMIPKALDSVLLHPELEVAKVASCLLAGLLLYDSWHRAHAVIKLFFVGGFCWTSAMVGMLYQESTSRLCSFYLLNDQLIAGIGLVVLAIALPALWTLNEATKKGGSTAGR